MAKIGGFDPGLGIRPLSDGQGEIGRANLPGAARLLPDSPTARRDGALPGRFTDSSILEGFGPYLAMELEHRELLAPDVFFEVLERAAESFRREAESGGGDAGEGPLVATARALAEVLADRELCETLRKLVLKA